jgi:hypothetical protein
MSQVVVLGLMLIGMIIGDSIANSMFGGVKGIIRQLLYLLFFVVFLVLGNYLPGLLDIPALSLFPAIIIFGFWGFSAVFFSRFILYLMDFIISLVKKIGMKKLGEVRIDAGALITYLNNKGINPVEIKKILANASGSKRKADKIIRNFNKGEKVKEDIEIDPYVLTSNLLRKGMKIDDILEILVKIVGFSPEKAVSIWRKST